MNKRLELHQQLVDVLGSPNVYFQPPSNTQMEYPCIVYSLNNMRTTKASNLLYRKTNGYTAIVIDPDADSEIPDRIIKLSYCSFSRYYSTQNLNHYAFNIYY